MPSTIGRVVLLCFVVSTQACGARTGLELSVAGSSAAGDTGGVGGSSAGAGEGGLAGAGTGGGVGVGGTGVIDFDAGVGFFDAGALDSGDFDSGSDLCPPEFFHAQFFCSPWTNCLPGSYLTADGTMTTDRQCVVCPSGSSSTVLNARKCDPSLVQLAPGGNRTCALFSDGSVKCWGENEYGQLGYGNTTNVDSPIAVGPVSLSTTPGVTALQLTAAYDYSCALLSDGTVTCWGNNNWGQLGYGNTAPVGDDELPSSVGPVQLSTTPGVTATQLAGSYTHTCALLSDGTIKCWGLPNNGELGYGNADRIGDDEVPASVGAIEVSATPGVSATQVVTGVDHTCALLSDGSVQCWGLNQFGQLGYGPTIFSLGENETPSSLGPVSVTNIAGVTVSALSAGWSHTCAVLSNGTVSCWGHNDHGQLGYGNTNDIGAADLASSAGPVKLSLPIDVRVYAVSAGSYHTCVLLSDANVQCWGFGMYGQLGYGNTDSIGDDELPSAKSAADAAVSITPNVGIGVTALSTGHYHTCVVLSDGTSTCWGFNGYGQLGRGNTINLGDDELPSSIVPLTYF